jgi:metal-dependent amidase/aminoacylase/carboxypeptidase family protein
VTALQTMVTRRFDVFDPVVLTIASFHAGTTDNVIPDEVNMLGSLRTFSAETRTRAMDHAVLVAREVAAAHGITATAGFAAGYPVTVNNGDEASFAQRTVTEVLGAERCLIQPFPLTGAEDFSFVLEQVPGAFVMLGACPRRMDPGTAPYNHSADAVFDDAVLGDGAALYAELALRRLAAA